MNTNTAILVSGAFRSYPKALGFFLNQLPESYHIFMCFPKYNKDQYLNNSPEFDKLLKNTRIKTILYLEDPQFDTHYNLDTREKNIYLQWYRIYKLFQEINPHHYSTIIRMRPDIQFTCNVTDFLAKLPQIQTNTIYIPKGFDIFHSSFQHLAPNTINDQFAMGTYDDMKYYSSLYESILAKNNDDSLCIISENLLYEHISRSEKQIQRIDIPYTLLLSQCFTISICGDSASGKSSLARLIRETLHFDKTLLFETDRYHKWERGAKEYQQYTHLHPEANHLEKLSTDAYKLKLGEDVFLVDYDHSTGKFTEPQCVEAKNFTIFCGLHTLYLDSLRDIMDLKIYMDIDTNLKEFWKIQRDTTQRGVSEEQVRKTIASRQSDFQEFIEPQKANANIWVRFYSSEPADPSQLQLEIRIQKSLLYSHFADKMRAFCIGIEEHSEITHFYCASDAKSKDLTNAAIQEGYTLSDLKDSYHGILQYFLILLTWKQSSQNM